jgi:hypothetical protein
LANYHRVVKPVADILPVEPDDTPPPMTLGYSTPMDDETHGFTPFAAEEREELIDTAFGSIPGRRLQAHLLAQAALNEIEGVDPEEIFRGIAESEDAGVAMGDAVFMDLPEERRQVLRQAAWAHARNAIEQAVRQLEHGCNQLKIDPRFPPETFALFAATPAMLSGILFKLESDPD